MSWRRVAWTQWLELAALVIGVVLLGVGGWMAWPPLGCLIPGAVIVWFVATGDKRGKAGTDT